MVRPITKIVLLVVSNSPTESDENIAKLSGNFGGARSYDDISTVGVVVILDSYVYDIDVCTLIFDIGKILTA